jgi:hypothetical protein
VEWGAAPESASLWLRPPGARWILARVAAVWLLLLGVVAIAARRSFSFLQQADAVTLLVLVVVAMAVYFIAGRTVRRVGAERVAPPANWRRRLWAASFWLTVLLVVSLVFLAFLAPGGPGEAMVTYEASVEPLAAGPYVVLLPALDGPRVVELGAGEAQIMRVTTERGEAWRVEAEGPFVLRASMTRQASADFAIPDLLTMVAPQHGAGRSGALWIYASVPADIAVHAQSRDDCGLRTDSVVAVAAPNWHVYRLQRETALDPFCGTPWYVLTLMMLFGPVVGLLGPPIILGTLALTVVEAVRALRGRRRHPKPHAGDSVGDA